MLVFGSNSARIQSGIITESCPHCEQVNCVEMNVLQKYFHFFWIPFFPTGKTGLTICKHCRKVMKLHEMHEGYRLCYENAKGQTSTPVWTFSGLVLTLLIAGWLTYTIHESSKHNAEMIALPQQGDIYTVKKDNSHYMLYKVSAVRGDTVFVVHSQVEAGNSKNTKYILRRGEEAFFKEQNLMLKAELQKMLQDGKILSVQREKKLGV